MPEAVIVAPGVTVNRLKRAKADRIAIGTSGFHRARLARLVDLPGAEADGC
jgi:hypothetical protein